MSFGVEHKEIKVLDHGYIKLIGSMGTEKPLGCLPAKASSTGILLSSANDVG
jgi:hypothetical protein